MLSKCGSYPQLISQMTRPCFVALSVTMVTERWGLMRLIDLLRKAFAALVPCRTVTRKSIIPCATGPCSARSRQEDLLHRQASKDSATCGRRGFRSHPLAGRRSGNDQPRWDMPVDARPPQMLLGEHGYSWAELLAPAIQGRSVNHHAALSQKSDCILIRLWAFQIPVHGTPDYLTRKTIVLERKFARDAQPQKPQLP